MCRRQYWRFIFVCCRVAFHHKNPKNRDKSPRRLLGVYARDYYKKKILGLGVNAHVSAPQIADKDKLKFVFEVARS